MCESHSIFSPPKTQYFHATAAQYSIAPCCRSVVGMIIYKAAVIVRLFTVCRCRTHDNSCWCMLIDTFAAIYTIYLYKSRFHGNIPEIVCCTLAYFGSRNNSINRVRIPCALTLVWDPCLMLNRRKMMPFVIIASSDCSALADIYKNTFSITTRCNPPTFTLKIQVVFRSQCARC